MTQCKGCGAYVRRDFPVSKSCIRFDDATHEQLPGTNDVWLCFVSSCKDECCVHCYMTHIEAKHPKLYSTGCAGCQASTLYKDFAEYGTCKPCVDKREPDENRSET